MYLDDILIYIDGTLKEHVKHVNKVLAKLKEYDLKINLDKCKFYKREVKYLGFIVLGESICIDPEKVKVIEE